MVLFCVSNSYTLKNENFAKQVKLIEIYSVEIFIDLTIVYRYNDKLAV
ncbi:hypothetical protein NIES4075_02030 [Tolypothrix sp. NIES-4075]|nr:hypothetical protein NIES4075_02030 [Tolypothrix sp. NIES-4075]